MFEIWNICYLCIKYKICNGCTHCTFLLLFCHKPLLNIEVWYSDQNSSDDMIDRFEIHMPNGRINCGQSVTHTIQGNNNIGNLAILYHNFTAEPASSTTVVNLITSTSTQTQQGNNTLCIIMIKTSSQNMLVV